MSDNTSIVHDTTEEALEEAILDYLDATSNEELRELIEQWREAAEYAKDAGNVGEYDGIAGCADELEAVIDDE